MMAEPEDMILPLLCEMRAENPARRGQTHEKFISIERRLDEIEAAQRSFRQARTADSLLSKPVTAEFEQRIEILERKVKEWGVGDD